MNSIKAPLIILVILIAGVVGIMYVRNSQTDTTSSSASTTTQTSSNTTVQNQVQSKAFMKPAVAVDGLSIPWDLAFLPAGDMLITERAGKLIHIKTDGTREIVPVRNVRSTGESGLLGIALHPHFEHNSLLYLYITQSANGGLINRVERYVYDKGVLSEQKIIINNIPGALYHDGGRIEFGPDGKLYITTGDATKEQLAQDKKSLAGKILRLNDDGSIPSDNPVVGSPIYSYGHRNPQGLAWDSVGQLWSTEHGRSGALSGLDEINLIKPGLNYGWPTIEGEKTKTGMEVSTLNSGANDTWAPASALYWDGSLFFGGLRGEGLFEAKLSGATVVSLTKHFAGEYGRIRTVRLGLDGMVYFTTSNADGRGTGSSGDDKIYKVNPTAFRN